MNKVCLRWPVFMNKVCLRWPVFTNKLLWPIDKNVCLRWPVWLQQRNGFTGRLRSNWAWMLTGVFIPPWSSRSFTRDTPSSSTVTTFRRLVSNKLCIRLRLPHSLHKKHIYKIDVSENVLSLIKSSLKILSTWINVIAFTAPAVALFHPLLMSHSV